MGDEVLPESLALARAEFDELVKDLRPDLHRYCARMTGSVVDGEDVVQDTLAKAYYSLPTMIEVRDVRSLLFRISHNKAIDFMRRDKRLRTEALEDQASTDESSPLEEKELARQALAVFLELAPLQRSSVILMDVLGHSLSEISELLEVSVPAVKSALNRGRTRLRQRRQSLEVDDVAEADPRELELLTRYVERFNARDFDALRQMLADDVRLDLVGRLQRQSARVVGDYFTRYDQATDWRMAVGRVEGELALLVYDPQAPDSRPTYFVLLDWSDGRLAQIRDYRYCRYVVRDARWHAHP